MNTPKNLFCAVVGLAIAASSVHANLVSVTTNAVTGGNAAAVSADRAANAGNLTGPAGDAPGSTWNIISDYSGTSLLDSTGAVTSIGYTTTFSERRGINIGSGDLELARIYMQDFGKGGSNSLVINGLTAGGFYNVWLVSVSNSGAGTEYYRGDLSTTNSTTSPVTQSIVSSPRNITTFVAGQNFVLFENVEADTNGEISFTLDAANLDGLPNTGDEYRFGLNGFQIEETTPPVVGNVDPAVSTVEASPESVFADGILTSTVTVTLKDSGGNVVAGKDVTLANTAGPQAATIDPLTAVTTNAAGQATFAVSSSTPGTEVFTATDVTDSNLLITQTASVEFIEVGVLANADQSTVTASPPSALADGTSASTITVTLLDANGFAVAGKDVTLANTSGPGMPVISPMGAVTTDSSGQAVFTVTSTTIGSEVFTATDTTDSITVTETATVGFVDPDAPVLISVTTDAVTGGNAAAVTAARNSNSGNLVGPAGDSPGSFWNIVSGYNATNLLDSTGATTAVGYTTTFSERRGIGLTSGDLEIARTYMQDFGKGGSNTLVINGLAAGAYYNVWLVSVSNSGAGTEYYRGDVITTNTTTSPATQPIMSTPRNVLTFEPGQNFVLFEEVEADVNGEITFTLDATNTDGLPNTGDEYRFGLNGFQIEETDAPLAQILTFEANGVIGAIDKDAKTITLDMPFGTDLATLAPTFTLTSGTCDQTSGAVPSPSFFAQNPVDYVVTDTSTDPDTVNTYSVTVNVAPQLATLVIDLGAGTTIPGGGFIGSGPTNLPLPTLPVGSILKEVEVNASLDATDNDNFAYDLALLFDPTPLAPGGDFSVGISNWSPTLSALTVGTEVGWAPGTGGGGPVTPLADTKTEADWIAGGEIDLGITGLFLGNNFDNDDQETLQGGTWSGTITLTYVVPGGGGSDYDTWAAGFPGADLTDPNGDLDGDGLTNNEERAFGLDPTDPASVNPFAVPLAPGTGTLSYTRRDPSLSGLTYSVWTSTDLQVWTEDTGAAEGSISSSGDIQTVPITLGASPVDGKLFVEIRAN